MGDYSQFAADLYEVSGLFTRQEKAKPQHSNRDAIHDVSRETNKAVLIVTLCIAIVFTIARFIARWMKLRRAPLELEDIFLFLALASWAIVAGLYLTILPMFYGLYDIALGLVPKPSAQESYDKSRAINTYFFVVQIFFWTVLWSVKLSLLFQFKKLTKGIILYERIWWGVLAFTILTWIASQITNLTSCHTLAAYFEPGACYLPEDFRNKEISLWFSLGCDLLTDVLIMAIPIRVLASLQINTKEKISIAFVFLVGVITMVAAIVRCVSLKGKQSGSGELSVPWLIFWGAIECAVAIIVACLPSFAIFIRTKIKKNSSGVNGYSNSRAYGPSSHIAGTAASKMGTRGAKRQSVMLDDLSEREDLDRWSSTNDLVGDSDGSLRKEDQMMGGISKTTVLTQQVQVRTEADMEKEKSRKLGFGRK